MDTTPLFFFGWGGVGKGGKRKKKELEGGKDLLEGFFGDVGEGGWEVPVFSRIKVLLVPQFSSWPDS